MRRFALLCASFWAVSTATHRADACGLSPPIGPTGLAGVCHGEDDAPEFRAGGTAGGTWTKIDFATQTATLRQAATTATFDILLFQRLSFSAAVGASLVGDLDYAGRKYDLSPGPLGGLGVAYRFLGGKLPFVHASVTYSLARSVTRAPDDSRAVFTSRDLRFGLAVGKTFGDVAAPFVVARYFGAGTSWPRVGGHGADHYRYHLGAGSAFGLSEHFDALAELAFLGERRATLGIGYAF